MGKQEKYADPPWIFKGRALYQLQLVKVAEAKKFIPRDLSIVSLFGYTLGGFYLARYEDSPVGAFNECVALAGIVWNRPASCAWAARVFVDDRLARDHGKEHVGLPSRQCVFSELDQRGPDARPSWWDRPVASADERKRIGHRDAANSGRIQDTEAQQAIVLREDEGSPAWWQPWSRLRRGGGRGRPICTLEGFPSALDKPGPRIRLSLPSYSGRTDVCPGLLRYALRLRTAVRLVPPLSVRCKGGGGEAGALAPILAGRPVLAVAFDGMEMAVQRPVSIPGRQVARDDSWEFAEGRSVPQLLSHGHAARLMAT